MVSDRGREKRIGEKVERRKRRGRGKRCEGEAGSQLDWKQSKENRGSQTAVDAEERQNQIKRRRGMRRI